MDDHESQHHHLKQNKGKNNDYDDNIDSNNSTDDHNDKSNAIPLMIMTTICRRWGIRSFTYSILLLCSHTPWLIPYSCPTSKFNHWHHWELHYCRSCWLSWWLFWKLIWTYSSISIECHLCEAYLRTLEREMDADAGTLKWIKCFV